MSLYDFSELKAFVKRRFDVDPDSVTSTFQRITARLNKEELRRRVRRTADGFYYKDDEGIEHKGFLYIGNGYARPHLDSDTGEETIVPRFHTCNCDTIAVQILRHNYDGHYVFSDVAVEMVEYDGTKKDPKLCSKCQMMMPQLRKRMTTEQYEQLLRNEAEKAGHFRTADLPKHIDVLESGYTPNWAEKSRDYRQRRKFTCEDCGIQLNERYVDGFYLETHHISGVKTDNRDLNLKCLCVLCHANVNEEHKRNYATGPNRQKLVGFIDLYRAKLVAVGNPYL